MPAFRVVEKKGLRLVEAQAFSNWDGGPSSTEEEHPAVRR